MINNQKQLVSFIDQILKPYNFIKKGTNWYLKTNECIVVFGIEKSNWGGQFGTVITLLVREIEDSEYPKAHQCHIHGLGLELLVNNRDEFERSLDLERTFQNEERESFIRTALIGYAIPLLLKVSTIAGLKDAIKEYEDLKYYITLKLKNHLGLES